MTAKEIEDLRRGRQPWIDGEVLFVRGPIDSNLYNTIVYDYVAMRSVKVVDLSSFGGQPQWAMEAARKIRELGLDTRIADDEICASACIPIFAAGKRRFMGTEAGLGVHAVRLKVGPATTFAGLCLSELEDGTLEFNSKRKGCQTFLDEQIKIAKGETDAIFSFAEAGGVSPQLRADYEAMPDDAQWFETYNVTRRPDWSIELDAALRYRLATDVADQYHH